MTPADLAAKGLRVKPLEWKPSVINFRPGECYHAYSLNDIGPYAIHRKHDGWWLNKDCKTHPTKADAKAAAEALHAARIASMIEDTPHDQT